MEIKLTRDAQFIELSKVIIRVNDVDFRISVNNFGELVVNKWQNGEGSGDISISPSVSNEIRIS